MSHVDRIDSITSFWGPRLGVDGSGFEVTARILLLAGYVLARRREVLEEVGLSAGEFDVLAATVHMSSLAGQSNGINLVTLGEAALVTSGAITKRIDRLERAGLVARSPDPTDRRGILVKATSKGRRTAERAVRLVVEAERDLVTESLSAAEREQILAPLTRFVASLDAFPTRRD